MQDILQRLLRRPLCLLAVSYAVCAFVMQILAATPLFGAPARNPGTVSESPGDLGLPEHAGVWMTGQLKKKERKNGHQIYYLKHIQIIEIQDSKEKSKQNFNFTNEKKQKEAVSQKEAVCYMASDVLTALPKEEGRTSDDIPAGRWLYVCGEVMTSERAENEGQFDAKAYDESRGVAVRLWDTRILQQGKTEDIVENMLVNIKQSVTQKYHEHLGTENAGVLCAMLLGDKTAMDGGIKKLYQKSGIAHVLAISGLHISLLGMMLYRFLRRCYIPPLLCSLLGVAGVLVYIRFAGASVSSVRAVCMFVLYMLADVLERTYDLLTALACSALLLLIQNPAAVFEAGCLLSYFAVLGLALVLPVFSASVKEICAKQKFCFRIVSAFLPGFSVQVFIFPITLWFYYEFPVYSFLLNLIVVPCMSLVLVTAILGALPGLEGILYLTGFLLDCYEWLCRLTGQFPGAVIVTGRPLVWQIVFYYMAVIVWLVCCCRESSGDACGKAGRKRWGCIWRLLFPLVCMSVFLLPVHRENRLDMLSVGQGDCICIRDSAGGVALVDGGSTDVSQAGTYRLLPFLKYHGISEVDAVFLSHAHADHYSAIVELLENGEKEGVRVKSLCLSAAARSKQRLDEASAEAMAYQEIIRLAQGAECEIVYLNPGDRVTCATMKFDCIFPSSDLVPVDENDNSMVLLARLKDFSVLFTGDSSAACDETVIRRIYDLGVQEIDCLKVAHHGAQTSTGRELLEAFGFDLALISCGAENSYGHPHEPVLKRLSDAGCKIFITAECGQVTVRIDEGKVKVRGFKDDSS